MNRRIWLSLLSTLLLTGVSASADTINVQSLLSAGACTTAPDPNTPGAAFGFPAGCWTLQNRNSDSTFDGAASGTALTGWGGITVTGSDANLVDSFGIPITFSTLTQFTTVISDTTPGVTPAPDGISLSGDLTFNWLFTTEDAGSFYDPAGYFLCSATPTGYPSNICGLYQLTSDLDALNPPDPLNPPLSPFAESGTVSVTLAPGDVFGAYVLSQDNMGGAGTITFSDPMVPSPEPATFLLIGGGFMGLSWIGRKARRRQAEKAARS